MKILLWMGSAVSTDPVNFTRRELCYAVSPPVRVRKEAFGLLFYNTQDSRLTFVKSRELLQIEATPNGGKMIAASLEPASRVKVQRVLDHLLNKGLIGEA